MRSWWLWKVNGAAQEQYSTGNIGGKPAVFSEIPSRESGQHVHTRQADPSSCVIVLVGAYIRKDGICVCT